MKKIQTNRILQIILPLVLGLTVAVGHIAHAMEDERMYDCGIDFRGQTRKQALEKITSLTGVKFSLGEGVDEKNLVWCEGFWGEYGIGSMIGEIFNFYCQYALDTDRMGDTYRIYFNYTPPLRATAYPYCTEVYQFKHTTSLKIKKILDEIEPFHLSGHEGGIEYNMGGEYLVMTASRTGRKRFELLFEYLDENEKRVNQSLTEIASGLLEKAKKRKEERKGFRKYVGMAMIIYKKLGNEEMLRICKEIIGKEIELLDLQPSPIGNY